MWTILCSNVVLVMIELHWQNLFAELFAFLFRLPSWQVVRGPSKECHRCSFHEFMSENMRKPCHSVRPLAFQPGDLCSHQRHAFVTCASKPQGHSWGSGLEMIHSCYKTENIRQQSSSMIEGQLSGFMTRSLRTRRMYPRSLATSEKLLEVAAGDRP